MTLLTINWAAFALAYVIGFVLSAVWFGPKTFYPLWWKLMGDRPMPTRETAPGSGLSMFALTMIGLFVQVAAIAVALNALNAINGSVSILDGVIAGLFVSLAAAATSLGHRMFAGHGLKVWAIEVTPDVISAVLAGAVLAVIR